MKISRFWLFMPFLRHNLRHLYKWWIAEILWEWKVSPKDSLHQIWYQYLLNFGCGVVLSHFHAKFTPFYANEGRFWNGSPFLLWSEAKNILWCQILCFLSAVYHGDKNDQNVILPFTPFTPLRPKLWSNDENTLQKW